jgi:predicted PurR-regulated permease PerM
MVFVIVFLLNQLEIISFLTGLLRILIPVFLGLFISIVLEEIIKRFINKGYKRKLVVIVTYITLLLTLIGASIIILPEWSIMPYLSS